MKTEQTATKSSVHEAIRADILKGVHSPGSPLKLAPLAAQFGVSMSAIREALVRLSEQHLTVLSPNQGFRVVSISRKDLLELTEVRVMIEGAAIELSVHLGDIAWESEVVAAHHVLERVNILREGEPGSTLQWSMAHERFHVALISACGNKRLLDYAHNLRGSAEVYLQLSADSTTRDPAIEHGELLALALGRNSEGARKSLEKHLRLTTKLLAPALPE